MAWYAAQQIPPLRYTCGHCGSIVGSNLGYYRDRDSRYLIYVCPNCDQPSYFFPRGQVPSVAPGNDVASLPADIERLYNEARWSIAASAWTASVLACRKLLMNIAVGLGAPTGQSFLQYVEFLASRGYVPPNGKTWVDHIRKKGNEANHEITLMSEADATELVSFAEMLLKFIYEFPNRVPK